MSRSKPELHSNNPNPARKWFEWDGANGGFRYYDKDLKQRVEVPDGFTFIVLDQLASVTGYNDKDKTGIYSNEVRDTKKETLTVKTFKGQVIGEGFYASIKDRVNIQGGSFTTVLYVAFKDNGKLTLGGVKFSGASLSSWMDFQKENRKEIWEKAVRIKGFLDKKKGRIDYRVPETIKLVEIDAKTDDEAKAIDADILQPYLVGYFGRTQTEQVSARTNEPEDHSDHSEQESEPDPMDIGIDPVDDSDLIPF